MVKTIGEPIKRVEDKQLISGHGKYLDDLRLTGTLHCRILRSSQPHAKIKRIDVSRAKNLPGVLAVITGADALAISKPCYTPLHGNVREPVYPMAIEKVNYVGQEIAAVAAINRSIAEDALDLIDVDYESLDPVLDVEEAIKPTSPLVRPDIDGITNNVSFEYKLEAGNISDAFNRADLVVEGNFELGNQHMAPLEPSGVLASYDQYGEYLTIWCTHQAPFLLRRNLSQFLQLPENKIRVIVPDMGGSFGTRALPYSHFIVACLLSKITGHPAKIVLDRREDLLATGHRNGCKAHLSLALSENGKMLGLSGRILWDTGAAHGHSSGSLSKGMLQMAGPYKIENVLLEGYCVYTNKALTDASRGFGQPQAVFIRERLIDIAAKKMKIDPLELRLRNVIQPEDVPYVSSTGPLFDSPNFVAALKLAAEKVGWSGILRNRPVNVGLGIALYQKNNSGYQSHGYGAQNLADYDTVRIEIQPDSSVDVYTGAQASGQGHRTFMAQIVSEELGIDMNQISVIYGDTERTPYGMGSFASRTAVISGGAVHLCCRKIKEKVKKVGAHLLGTTEDKVEFGEGSVFLKGLPKSNISLGDIIRILYTNPWRLPKDVEPILSETATYDPPGKMPFDIKGRSQIASTYDIGAYAVVIQVDPETGNLQILNQSLAYDCGRVINPMIVEGQHHGALLHGIAMAAYESLEWNEEGQPLNPTFMDFLTPTAIDVRVPTNLEKLESKPIYQEWGYRGVGESGTIAPAAAVANAVSDAVGRDFDYAPIAPEEILNEIEGLEKDEDGRPHLQPELLNRSKV